MDTNTYLEIFGAVTGLMYVYLEIVQKRSMWVVGGISALIYIAVFMDSGLFAATFLQVCFFVMSIYGWIVWGQDNSTEPEEKVRKMSRKVLVNSLMLSVAAYAAVTFLLINFSDDPMPYLDSLIAVMSLLATYWVTGRYAENWIVWIINNAVAIFLYASQGLYPTVLLYLAYLIAAFVGYWHWRKIS